MKNSFLSSLGGSRRICNLVPGDWVCQSSEDICLTSSWVHQISVLHGNKFVMYCEYKRTLEVGRLVQFSSQDLQLSSFNLKLVPVLVQETYHISPFKLPSLDSNLKPNFLI